MKKPVLTLEQVCKAMDSSADEMEREEEPLLHSPLPLQLLSEGEPAGVPLGPVTTSSISEMNLLHMRGSFSMPTSPAGTASLAAIQEMEQFALQAEESAQQARQLAEWAHGIVRQLKTGVLMTGTNFARFRDQLPSVGEGEGVGTPVDPVSSQTEVSTGNHVHASKSCPSTILSMNNASSQQQNNKCNLM